jgi:hypothetical protein
MSDRQHRDLCRALAIEVEPRPCGCRSTLCRYCRNYGPRYPRLDTAEGFARLWDALRAAFWCVDVHSTLFGYTVRITSFNGPAQAVGESTKRHDALIVAALRAVLKEGQEPWPEVGI